MNYHQKYLLQLAARLVLIVSFAALLYDSSPGFAMPILGGDSLGAQSFAVLGGTAVTNVPTDATVITGDLGVSPNNVITGFPNGIVNGTIHNNDGPAIAAQAAATAAFTGLGGLGPPVNLTGQDLGNRTLIPGIYFLSDATALLNGPNPLFLDAQGNSKAVWVFQIQNALTTGTGSVVQVINTGGSNPADQGVFWQVGTMATLGPGSTFEGNILAGTSITLDLGAQIDCGRALAQAAVTMAGFGGSPVARDNAVSIGCAGTAGFGSSTDASGFSAGLQIDEEGHVSFIPSDGVSVPEPSSFLLLLTTGLIGVAARMRRARARSSAADRG